MDNHLNDAGARRRSMELYFRPVYNAEYQSTYGFQTQVRINDNTMGVLLPQQYMPIAGRTNQCCEIAKWAIEQACISIVALKKRKVDFAWISVYSSIRYLTNKTAVEQITGFLNDNQVQPAQLCICSL